MMASFFTVKTINAKLYKTDIKHRKTQFRTSIRLNIDFQSWSVYCYQFQIDYICVSNFFWFFVLLEVSFLLSTPAIYIPWYNTLHAFQFLRVRTELKLVGRFWEIRALNKFNQVSVSEDTWLICWSPHWHSKKMQLVPSFPILTVLFWESICWITFRNLCSLVCWKSISFLFKTVEQISAD